MLYITFIKVKQYVNLYFYLCVTEFGSNTVKKGIFL